MYPATNSGTTKIRRKKRNKPPATPTMILKTDID
jgi:hypothetical protein